MLYLRGLSTGDFREALAALLGDDAAGLSATNIARLTNEWETEYRAFQKRSLADRDYVYVWVDGVHFNVRLEDDPPLNARHDRRAARRNEGADRGRGRLPRERRELEDGAPRPKAQGHARSYGRRRRRRPRLLGGGSRGVAEDLRAAGLVPQAREHSRQAAEAAPAAREGRAPRGHVCRDPRAGP